MYNHFYFLCFLEISAGKLRFFKDKVIKNLSVVFKKQKKKINSFHINCFKCVNYNIYV